MKKITIALTLALSFLVMGCGKPTATVEGKVTYKKDPVPLGEIHFVGENGVSRSSPIGSDGTYKIVDAPLGQVVALVEAKKRKETAKRLRLDSDTIEESELEGPSPEFISLVPEKYSVRETSPFNFKIVSGKQIIDLDLKD
jgi:hypothetical protein